MKALSTIGFSLIFGFSTAFAQTEPQSSNQITLNKGDYEFRIGGMVQFSTNIFPIENAKTQTQIFPQRTFFNLSAKSNIKNIGFFVQTDFSMPSLLLDALVEYQPLKNLNIEMGQRQNIGNNREMMIQEGFLQTPDRGILSTQYSKFGRDFGLYTDYTFSLGSIQFNPQISITSGDGMNSFGIDSRDVDQGGLKYSARLDIYPFGGKKHYRQIQISSITHQDNKLWAVLGLSGSINSGVNDPKGEGHNQISLYNSTGSLQFPNYRRIGSDLLLHWGNLSLLAEYSISTASNLEGTYLDAFGSQKLKPTQISEYLNLGNGFQIRGGYIVSKSFELFGQFGRVTPEFKTNPYSLVQPIDSWKVGLSKYAFDQRLRLQLSYGKTTSTAIILTNPTTIHAGAQMIF